MAINHIVFLDKSMNRIVPYQEFYDQHKFQNCDDFINSVFKSIYEELDTEKISICDRNISEIFLDQLEEIETKFENSNN